MRRTIDTAAQVSQGRMATLLLVLLSATLAGCAMEWQNPQAARQLAREQQAPGSTYLGWRVYQDRCAGCHGADARGSANAPSLLARLQTLGPRQFVSLVLYRYDSTLQGQPAAARDAREAQVDSLMTRQNQPLLMPTWQNEPRVSAHVLDLYAYLSARSEGRIDSGRPSP